MSIMADRWIRERALKDGMIEPFEDGQRRDGMISYGLSSYGYDARVSDEFKIFTNVDNAIVDPKDFAANSFVDRKTDCCIIPPNSFAPARTVESFPARRAVPPRQLRQPQDGLLHHCPQQLRARPHGRVFPRASRRAGDLPRQIDL